MTYNTERAGFWAALRGVPRRMSLRLKLVTALLVLVGIALAVTTLVGNAILKNYLLSPYDSLLRQDQPAATQTITNFLTNGTTGSRQNLALDFVSAGRVPKVIQPSTGFGGFNTPEGFQSTLMPGPALQASLTWLVERS